MRALLLVFLFPLVASAEEMLLISWHPGTANVYVTAFPWHKWRKKLPGKTDPEIWAIKYPGCIPEALRPLRHVAVERDKTSSLLPLNRDKRSRWRWNAQQGRVVEDMALPEQAEEKRQRLKAVISSPTAARDEKLDALLELQQ